MKSFSIIFALSHTTIAVEEEEEEFANRIIIFFVLLNVVAPITGTAGIKYFISTKELFMKIIEEKS